MLSFLRASHPPLTTNATKNPITYENGLSSVFFHKPDSDFIMTHTIPPTTKENGVSIIIPPFHYHIDQDEYFRIQSGSATIYKGINPRPFTTLSASPGGLREATIPRKMYHRFENASETETLVIDIQLSPEDYENEQRFFRNFFGYLADCKSAKTAPSFFQLMVFLNAADTPLALPLPNHSLGIWLSRGFMIGAAFMTQITRLGAGPGGNGKDAATGRVSKLYRLEIARPSLYLRPTGTPSAWGVSLCRFHVLHPHHRLYSHVARQLEVEETTPSLLGLVISRSLDVPVPRVYVSKEQIFYGSQLKLRTSSLGCREGSMAAQPAPSSSSDRLHPHNSDGPTKRRTLPEGPCNFRDLNGGSKPPSCGCRRFWYHGELTIPAENATIEPARYQEQDTWCVCGHHACFHDRLERTTERGMAPPPAPDASKRRLSGQADNLLGSQRVGLGALGHEPQGNTFEGSGRDGIHGQHEGIGLRDDACNDSALVFPSLESFSVNSSELRAFNGYDIRELAQPEVANTTAGAYAASGLGLTLYERSVRQARQLTQSPTVADSSAAEEVSQRNPYLSSTMQASSGGGARNISPTPDFLHRIMNQRAGPVPEVSPIDNVAIAFEDFVQNSTELATPTSVGNTPDFEGLDRLVQDTRQAINTVTSLEVSPNANIEASPKRIMALQNSQDPQARSFHKPSPVKDNVSIREAVRKMPATLQQLVPILNSLQGYLSRNPDISIHESINSLSRRMDSLENASFSHVPPEQINQQFENVDGRIVDLENRVDEHGRILGAFAPGENLQERHLRRLEIDENASLSSRQSRGRTDSDRMDIDRRVKDVEDRLGDLEKSRPPSFAHPWEIEVVLLPWGRELKGIWYPTDELLKPGMTQDSDVWTQACSVPSQSRPSVSLGVDRNAGWSSQAIHDWADSTEHWLSPKACGTNSVVFHRLRSRGLVRTVMLNSPGARDVQVSITRAYDDLLDTLSGPNPAEEVSKNSLPRKALLGMSAPFIPLRKVHKSSRLRFLTPPDLVSPALWTVDFLASGVLMRAPAGRKRLFITTHESYKQRSTDEAVLWTWDKVRALPHINTIQALPNVQTEAQARETVVMEACWGRHPTLDGPPSVHSSFASHRSASFHDPSDYEEISQSEESEREPDEGSPEFQPITPTSEFPTQRSLYARTVSVSLSDVSSNFALDELQQRSFPQQPRRRMRQFKQSNNPGIIASLPTFIPSPSKTRSHLGKRRRLARSRSSPGSAGSRETSVDVDPERVIMHVMDRVSSGESIKPLSAFTPRWSKEPSSPFFERSTKVGGSQSTDFGFAISRSEKRALTPSAYATPFSGTNFNSRAVGEEESGDEDVWGGVEEHNAVSVADEDVEVSDEGYDDHEGDEVMDEGEDDGDADDEEMSQSLDELQAEYHQ